MEMGEVEVEIEPLGGPAHLGVLVEGTERPTLQAAGELAGPRALLRDDVDDAADRIGAVKSALRAAYHFDALDVPSQDAEARCLIDVPALREVKPGHMVACHLR